MTRKEYRAFAEIIKAAQHMRPEEQLTFVAKEMCLVFKQDNSAFDRDKFLEACGCNVTD